VRARGPVLHRARCAHLPYTLTRPLPLHTGCRPRSFHLDHIASLPYLTEKTNFRGKVFMTHATKAIGILMIRDYLRVR
jgi:hypothetical protein